LAVLYNKLALHVIIMPHKKNILIVEDEKINRELLAISLSDTYTLTFADNLELAIKYISEITFQLIITDISLGNRFDGIKVLKYSKSLQSKNSQTLVLAYTASETSINQKSFTEEGFDGIISKPIIKSEILKQVKNYISSK
jgi:CheY-like chemotaxis protein